jgi:hypothetical protein
MVLQPREETSKDESVGILLRNKKKCFFSLCIHKPRCRTDLKTKKAGRLDES